MKTVSQTVLEWQAEARAEGRAEGVAMGRVEKQAESILRLLNLRFPGSVPAVVADGVRAGRDMAKLDRWFDAAATTPSVEDFLHAMSNSET